MQNPAQGGARLSRVGASDKPEHTRKPLDLQAADRAIGNALIAAPQVAGDPIGVDQ